MNMRLSVSMKSPLIESEPPVGCCRKVNIVMASPANMRLSLSMMDAYAEITNALFARNVEPLGGTKESNLICESHH